MIALRVHRIVRATSLRCLRAVRRHHFSVLSAGVLVVALGVALTDGSLGIRSAREIRSPQAVGSSGPDTGAPAKLPALQPNTGWVIYYIVDSAKQMDMLGSVRRGETAYVDLENPAPMPATSVHYLLFDTPQQEAAGASLLNHVAELAAIQGFNLKVIDLTQ